MTALPLDPARIRAHFPAFSEPTLKDFAFFESAGGSFVAQQVVDRLERGYRTKMQDYSFIVPQRAASEAYDQSYRRIAEALNVTPEWITFGPSTSANTATLANALREWLRPGDAIVVTNQDHEANTGKFRALHHIGIEVREWRVDRHTGRLDMDQLDTLLDAKVRVIAFPHVSNVVGEINPVAEIAAKARSLNAITIVDGVSAAPHGLPDLMALGCDIYLFSAYKTYGPHQGVLAMRPELLMELPNQSHFFNEEKPRYRMNPAGPDHAQVMAMAGIADYLETVAGIAGDTVEGPTPFHRAHAAMRAQESALLVPLLDFIAGRNDVRLIGPADPAIRVPTVALALEEKPSDAAARLGSRGIICGAGNFFAYRLFQGIGIEPDHGALRLSFVHYTTPEEVTRLIEALDAEL
jgi:selenocysteine lyase/cysteine desulfurase